MAKRLLIHFFLIIFGSIVLFFFGIGLGLLLMRHYSESAISDLLQGHTTSFVYWRYGLFILLMLFWRPLIASWGKTQQWPKRYIVKILQLRMQVVIFFALFEWLLWIMH